MNRLYSGLTLFMAGFFLSFLGSSLTKDREPAWTPSEDQSPFLSQMASESKPRDFCVDTRATTIRPGWQPRGITHATLSPTSEAWRPSGVRVKLVSYFDNGPPVTSVGGSGQNCTFTSVSNGKGSSTCSTANGSTSCSVNGTNNLNPVAAAACSTNGNNSYCTASPGGAGSTVVACSSYGTGNAGGNACSAGDAPGSNTALCSVSASRSGNTANFCTSGLAAGSGNTTCSVGPQSGLGNPPSGSQAQCTATNATSQTKFGMCSVQTDGDGNTCSATQGGAGTSCSAYGTNNGGTSYVCSVFSGFKSAYCTSYNADYVTNPGGSNCSVGYQNNACSTFNTDGTFVGGPDSNGYCGADPEL